MMPKKSVEEMKETWRWVARRAPDVGVLLDLADDEDLRKC
jgi:hypothetical protein